MGTWMVVVFQRSWVDGSVSIFDQRGHKQTRRIDEGVDVGDEISNQFFPSDEDPGRRDRGRKERKGRGGRHGRKEGRGGTAEQRRRGGGGSIAHGADVS